ncbi:MAG: tyrosine-type recombinase/integrase [Mucilaginibacter sp.]|uniref:tyrosine-type recombinase/integrase n=1 Tax=Mucilaginibacter sp. TaxID=1882438 RepID=UPI0032651B36
MQISLKILLYKQKTYADGTHPVVLQYIINRKAKKKVLTRCLPEEWDTIKGRIKRNAPGANRKNEYIGSEYAKAENLLYDIKSGNRNAADVFGISEKFTLRSILDAELARLKLQKKSGTYGKILVFQSQILNLDIHLQQMDKKWFDNLIVTLISDGNNPNTVKKKVNTLRQIMSRYDKSALSDDVKAISVPGAKIVKQKLTPNEFAALEGLSLPDGDLLTATRDMFIMQVYLRGIRVGDVLQAHSRDFTGGKFTYKADKTDKVLTIKLIPAAMAIVDKYNGKHQRLFPFFTWVPDIKASEFENDRARLRHKEVCTSVVNRYLKVLAVMAGIKKPLSSHIARHTFARMAIDKINNPMITMELLGHSSLAVHQAYLNDIRKEDELDQAADDIFNTKKKSN